MATIKDVAKLAGVGVGTVSRSMSVNQSVSDKSRQKIKAAMEALNYRPNSMARSLSSKKSNIIGLWVPSFSGSFHRKMLQTIEEELRQKGKHIILANAEGANTDEERIKCLDYLIERDCDGILMSCPELSLVELAKIASRYPNILFLNRSLPEPNKNFFSINHYAGGRLAAEHLVGLGHTEFAIITGRMSAQDAQNRHQGFIDYLLEKGITVDPELIIFGGYKFTQGTVAVKELLGKNKPFSALFCGNDKSAMAAISILHSKGIQVGKEVSVVGYDDIDIAAYTAPALTSVHAPIESLSRNACHKILNLCYGENLPVETQFEPHLVVRKSSHSVNTIKNKVI